MSRYYSLDIKIPLFKPEINPFEFPKVRHTQLSLDKLNPEIISLFSSLNLRIVLVEVFYSKPGLVSGIHIDSNGGDINKINWVFGGKNCTMNWYSVKPGNINKVITKTDINTKYQSFSTNEVILEDSTVLHSPALVHVGVPHNVQNCLERRWCVSLVYEYKDTKIRPSMFESLQLFDTFLK
jgi:hypothetical protein